MKRDQSSGETLLTPAEVAALFRVDPKTVTRWAKAGKISSIRTLGGHRRYRESEVRQLLGVTAAPQRTGLDGPERPGRRFGRDVCAPGPVARGRFELPTPRFSAACSAN